MLLKDKIVVVSGIGPGLGIKLARGVAQQGAAGVVIAARTQSKLDQAEEDIRALGFSLPVLKVATDIADRAQCDALVARAVERFGRVDALINSAYIAGKFEPIESADLDDWRKTLDVNLFGSLNLTQAVIPTMKQQGGGAVVMINTMVTRKPMPWQSGYGTSKGALRTATAHLALELGPYNIRVNSCFMGWMWGPPVQGFLETSARQRGISLEQAKAEVAANIPLRRIPEDGECANAALFLASDMASAITGAVLDVNGGEYIPG